MTIMLVLLPRDRLIDSCLSAVTDWLQQRSTNQGSGLCRRGNALLVEFSPGEQTSELTTLRLTTVACPVYRCSKENKTTEMTACLTTFVCAAYICPADKHRNDQDMHDDGLLAQLASASLRPIVHSLPPLLSLTDHVTAI